MTAPLVRHLRHLHRLGPDADDAELLRQFRSASDGAATAALVKRHGPMVLGV